MILLTLGNIYKKTRNKLATFILGAVFIAFAVACIVCANVFTYKSVDATVVSYRSTTEFGQTFYYATYTYTVKGQEYKKESQISWTYDGENPEEVDAYEIGTTQRIKYKNTDPSKIYEADGSDRIEDDYAVLWWVLGVACIVATVLIFAIGVNKTELIENSATASSEPELADGQVRCQYCGGILGKDDKVCSGCGAKRSN